MNAKLKFHLSFAAMLTLAAGLVAGCEKRNDGIPSSSTTAPEKHAAATAADFLQRYQAAMQINEISKRDDALEGLAKDAAKVGEGDVVKKALMGINSINTRDSAASAAAVALAHAGKRADGTAVAQLINSIAVRDSTLAKLASE